MDCVLGTLLPSLSAMCSPSLLLVLRFHIHTHAGFHRFGKSDPAHYAGLPGSLIR